MLRVIWIAAALACSSRPPPAQRAAAPVAVADAGAPVDALPLDQDLPRLVDRLLAMYQDVGKAFSASQGDCAAATARLRELTGRYRDAAAANAKVLHDGRDQELRAALGPRGEAFDAAAAAVLQSPTMSRCAQDAAFSKAFDDLVAP
ncbi:MAG TPA: hypothetical protein VGD37_05260 [Kofleriaceae bacterium]|jgi:hypothetical protein